MQRFFLNYRRTDARAADKIATYLAGHFNDSVFLDSLEAGPDGRPTERVAAALGTCDTFVILVSRDWERAAGGGEPGLGAPEDRVRVQIEEALVRWASGPEGGVPPRILVALIGGRVRHLSKSDLPLSLHPLMALQDLRVDQEADVPGLRAPRHKSGREARIFISYRKRTDKFAAEQVKRFCDTNFASRAVFFDEYTIDPGEPFPPAIRAALNSCEAFLVVAGRDWERVRNNAGKGLDDPDDWVRREIEHVLKRNARAGPGRPPVKVLVVKVGHEEPIDRSALPASLVPVADAESIVFTRYENLAALHEPIDEQLGEPPTGDFSFHAFTRAVNRNDDVRYRFRVPANLSQLWPFVDLSDNETVISSTHPELYDQTRRALYRDWGSLSAPPAGTAAPPADGTPMGAFLVLDRLREGHGDEPLHWEPVAVSIALPLSESGMEHLQFSSTPPEDPTRRISAVSLAAGHFKTEQPAAVLLDTWIVARASGPGEPASRQRHDAWGYGLLLRHLGMFWDPSSRDPMTILAEPDNPEISRLLSELRFIERERDPAVYNGNICHLDLPPLPGRFRREDLGRFQSLFRTVEQWRALPVERDPDFLDVRRRSAEIDSTKDWQDVFYVRSGYRLVVTASRLWSIRSGPPDVTTGPDGFDAGTHRVVPDGVLIGRIGGSEFEIGSGCEVKAAADGMLQARVRDADLSDNFGCVLLTITAHLSADHRDL